MGLQRTISFVKENDSLPAWRIVKLGEIFEEVDIRAKDYESGIKLPLLSLTKNYGLIPQKQRFDKRIATQDLSEYKVVKKNWLVYNPYVLWEGAIYFLKDIEIGVVSPVYLVWKLKDGVDPHFIDHLIRTGKMLREFLRVSTGAVQRRRAIKPGSFLNISIMLPSISEQEQIAEILTFLNSILSSIEKAVKKAEILKRGLMQKLFLTPLEFERLKDKSSNFFEYRISDIADLQSGGTPARDKLEYWKNGNINWLKSGELNDSIIIGSGEKISASGLDNSSAKIFPKGTLLMALYGKGTVSKTGLLGVEAATNQAICAFIPKDKKFVPRYLQYYLIFSRNRILSQMTNPSTDVGRTNIYLNMLESMKVILPSDVKQQAYISDFLATLERKIEINKNKKRHIQELKEQFMSLLLSGRIRIKEKQTGNALF